MTPRAHIVGRLKLLLPLVFLSALVALLGNWAGGGDPARSVEGLHGGENCPVVEPGSFHWVWEEHVEFSGALDWHPAVFLAREHGDSPRDVYVADFRVTSDGRLRDLRRMTNLSRSADVDEELLDSCGRGKAVFAARIADSFESFSLVDFRGEPEALTSSWSDGWKMANGVTNFQRTGRPEGLHWRTYLFRSPTEKMTVSFEAEGARTRVATPSGEVVVAEDGSTSGLAVTVQEMVKGQPALLAWAVDTVRAVPWVGRRKIEWMEKYWFDFNDWLARTRYELVGESEDLEAEGDYPDAVAAVGDSGVPGWPPEKLKPILRKPRQGEGIWAPVEEPQLGFQSSGIPLFYKTFFRADRERPFVRVHLTTWDPNRVELRMVAGVREPISSTGVKGKGEIPREEGESGEVGRLVGAFNGAFQALHGEWGMAVDRKILLPPRAYGATIAALQGGEVAMGTWPNPVGEIPPEIRDLRQNVHPLVEGGEFNPYKRKWWGGVPEGVDERVVTTRSGICMTFGGKMIYFWGEHLSPESLGESMTAAGCDYGIHLDMNSGHCGFEYYKVARADAMAVGEEELDPKMEAEGQVPRRSDLTFRARKMVRDMGHMRFPRYIGRDPRDFFYLLRRPSILDSMESSAGRESVAWKPLAGREGFPVPGLVAQLEDSESVYKFDTRQVAVSLEPGPREGAILSVPFVTSSGGIATGLKNMEGEVSPLVSGAPGLGLDDGKITVLGEDQQNAGAIVQGIWPTVGRQVTVRHAFGVDPDGNLLVGSADNMERLEALLEPNGAKSVFGLIGPGAGETDVHWLVVRHRGASAWKRIFTDVEPVGPDVWRKVFRERGRLLDHGDE